MKGRRWCVPVGVRVRILISQLTAQILFIASHGQTEKQKNNITKWAALALMEMAFCYFVEHLTASSRWCGGMSAGIGPLPPVAYLITLNNQSSWNLICLLIRVVSLTPEAMFREMAAPAQLPYTSSTPRLHYIKHKSQVYI